MPPLLPRRLTLVAIDLENAFPYGWWGYSDEAINTHLTDILALTPPAAHTVLSACPDLLTRILPTLLVARCRTVPVRPIPDAADNALIRCLAEAPARTDDVLLVSGDAAFTDPVRSLTATGTPVVVAAPRAHIARSLADAATTVLHLPVPGRVAASV